MTYLKLNRSRILFASFLVASLLLWAIPEIDIRISQAVFNKRSAFENPSWGAALFHAGMGYFVAISLTSIAGIYLFNKLFDKDFCGVDGKKALLPFLVLILGAGLIVNVAFKDQFGRARPRDVVEFGGSKRFTPAFVVSKECDSNCSFSSGEGAAAFFSLSLALALGKRRSAFVAAFAFGCLASYFRMSAGAHFFSDVVVSFFIMLIVTDILHHYLLVPRKASEEYSRIARPILIPALVRRT